MVASQSPRTPSSDANVHARHPRACQFCRVRKIKCDRILPICSSCNAHGRTCVYSNEQRRPRPSAAIVSSLQKEVRALQRTLADLKHAQPAQVAILLEQIDVPNGISSPPDGSQTKNPSSGDTAQGSLQSLTPQPLEAGEHDTESETEPDFNPSNHVSIDDHGRVEAFGLTSTLHDTPQDSLTIPDSNESRAEGKYQLIANAALQRQQEYRVRLLPDIDGVPIDMAQHLLDLHWNRQHHTFLLTYRPAIMRDLVYGGPNCSKLLVNAIFACASKYSDRAYLRDDQLDPLSAGGRFFRRCDELITTELTSGRPSIPTIVSLLLLGSTYIARGDVSKGWLYSGLAIRMVYDLGLHIDCRKPDTGQDEQEVRRRVFWGAFICDKLQSLYLGRPMAMSLNDNHCPTEFHDTFEELEAWMPYIDFEQTTLATVVGHEPTPIYSVSTFLQLCNLSKIMSRIIACLYSAKSSATRAASDLHILSDALSQWKDQLPAHLAYDPIINNTSVPSPNVLNLYNIYHSLVILLNRPFVSDGHLRSRVLDTARACWKACTAAARSIASIVSAYRTEYTLRGAPYLTSYAAYVSCTIHVRNAAVEHSSPNGEHHRLLMLSLSALDELSTPNPGVTRPAAIIRRLMKKYDVMEKPTTLNDNFSGADLPQITDESPQSSHWNSLFETFITPQNYSTRDHESLISQDSHFWEDDGLFGFMDSLDTVTQEPSSTFVCNTPGNPQLHQ
ncbi:fungal-specific transcription factor domain-containing protein [Xylariaceae sp. FL1272]|nr:fungal-specific transcription factor domain-containing protein [Xylariaceae sp. FL1272]